MMSLKSLVRFSGNILVVYNHRRYKHRKYVSKLYQNLGQVQPVESKYNCKSQKLMIYNDIISQSHPGAFYLLPLGQRVFEKLVKVIDEELEKINAQKISMPTLAQAQLWKKTERWDDAGPELFRLKDRHDNDFCLSPTHEELVTYLVSRDEKLSYKRLPLKLYQISRKFRDEMHPRYGLLRGREFEMKDMYTFDSTEENAKITYDEVCQVYENIFKRLGLDFKKVIGATGKIGGSLSHEYQLPSSIGEDTIEVCSSCDFGRNIEIKESPEEKTTTCPKCGSKLDTMPAIEIGHSFLLGRKYSGALNAYYFDSQGRPQTTEMGCYGLGVTRIIQAGIEVLSEENRIRWPQLLSPYQICIIPQKEGSSSQQFLEIAETFYDDLVTTVPHLQGEVVIDDRTTVSVGKRLYEADRIGYPYVIIVGKQALAAQPLLELQDIYNKTEKFMPQIDIIEQLKVLKTV